MSTDLAVKAVDAAYNEYYKNVPENVIYRNEHFSAVFAEAVRQLLRDCYYDPPKGSSVGEAAQVVVDNKMAGMVFNDVVVRRFEHVGVDEMVRQYDEGHNALHYSQLRPVQPVAIIRDGLAKEEPPEVRPGVVVRLKSGGPKMTVRLVQSNESVVCGYFIINGHDRRDNPVYGTYCETAVHKDALELWIGEEA